MKLRLLSIATADIRAAYDYYEKEQHCLGARFWRELDTYLDWIRSNPDIPRVRPGNYRRVNLKTFPYYIAYTIWNEEITILAVVNSHREPEFWIDRM